MLDKNNKTIVVGLGALLLLAALAWALHHKGSNDKKCTTECYESPNKNKNASFSAKRPKNVYSSSPSAPPRNKQREGFALPKASQLKVLSAPGSGLVAGFNDNTKNPFLGMPASAIMDGPSAPIASNRPLLAGVNNTPSMEVLRTVI